MPCDIGYRSLSDGVVAAPAPQTFDARVAPPEVDADLLERLGVRDPVFLGWLQALDPGPLLSRALERALAAAPRRSGAEFAIRNGRLAARATWSTPAEKAAAEADIAALANRWTMEVLRVVAELLDYQVVLTPARESGREVLVLEGEKGGTGDVREFLRIVVDAARAAQIRFEHFASDDALAAEEIRFLALARKLGLRIAVAQARRAGKPIPKGAVHRRPQSGGERS